MRQKRREKEQCHRPDHATYQRHTMQRAMEIRVIPLGRIDDLLLKAKRGQHLYHSKREHEACADPEIFEADQARHHHRAQQQDRRGAGVAGQQKAKGPDHGPPPVAHLMSGQVNAVPPVQKPFGVMAPQQRQHPSRAVKPDRRQPDQRHHTVARTLDAGAGHNLRYSA